MSPISGLAWMLLVLEVLKMLLYEMAKKQLIKYESTLGYKYLPKPEPLAGIKMNKVLDSHSLSLMLIIFITLNR